MWTLQILSSSCVPSRSFMVVIILVQIPSEEHTGQQELLSAFFCIPAQQWGYSKEGSQSNCTDFTLICKSNEDMAVLSYLQGSLGAKRISSEKSKATADVRQHHSLHFDICTCRYHCQNLKPSYKIFLCKVIFGDHKSWERRGSLTLPWIKGSLHRF